MSGIEQAIESFTLPEKPDVDPRAEYGGDPDEHVDGDAVRLPALDPPDRRPRDHSLCGETILCPCPPSPKGAHAEPEPDHIHDHRSIQVGPAPGLTWFLPALDSQHTDRSVGMSRVGVRPVSRNEGKPATQAERSRARREQILDAAFHTFSRRGYRDTAVDEIAAAAETSKGGVYFHFPTKEAIFRELVKTTADRLAIKVERAVAEQTDPIDRADAALRTVLLTFAGHRTMARLLFVDAMGAGRVFNAETNALHDRFAGMIAGYLDEAVASGAIPPIDTALTGVAWFGALNEVVARWLLVDDPAPLETVYPTLRALLLRSVGVDEARIAAPPELGA